MLAGVRSKSIAPASVQTARTNISFPYPLGPASKTDFTWGVDWCKWGVSSGKMQYSFTTCLISPKATGGSCPTLYTAGGKYDLSPLKSLKYVSGHLQRLRRFQYQLFF